MLLFLLLFVFVLFNMRKLLTLPGPSLRRSYDGNTYAYFLLRRTQYIFECMQLVLTRNVSQRVTFYLALI